MALISSRRFRKNLGNLKDFFGQMVYRPPWQKISRTPMRLLDQIKWAAAKFNFQYLLRIDDDYFLCPKRLLSELPSRPKQNLVWGFFHCEAGITWLDEAFMIFTKDIIQKFLGAERKLDVVSSTCGPTSDVVAEKNSKENILPRY